MGQWVLLGAWPPASQKQQSEGKEVGVSGQPQQVSDLLLQEAAGAAETGASIGNKTV